VTLTADATNVALTSIDASALTGKLVAGTDAGATAAATIKGGTASDTLTANHASDVLFGNAGNDTLTVGIGANLVTLTGGAGTDKFVIAGASSNSNNGATITDLSAGEVIQFPANAANFKAAKLALDGTAVFQDYANEAVKQSFTGDLTWFQVGGNTYIVDNTSGSTSFVNGTDVIVKIAGIVDLSTSSMSSTADTALYIL